MPINDASTTVIIPTFNRAHYIRASLESILGQALKPTRVVVVNDGSTDATEEVLSAFRDQVTYIYQENRGKPAAINTALQHVDTKYIWVFDDDDVAMPDALGRYVQTLEAAPAAGFTFGHSYHCTSPDGVQALCVHWERKVRRFSELDDFFHLLLSSYVGSPAVLVRADIQRRAGLYNETLIRSQDWEMAIRWALLAPARRTEGDHPTFFRRMHSGPRGIRNKQFGYSKNTQIARAAEREILLSLLPRIPLDRYLSRPHWGRTLTRDLEARAHLRKFGVFMNKGLWEHAGQALEDLLACKPEGEIIATELQTLGRGICPLESLMEMSEVNIPPELARLLYRSEFDDIRLALRMAVHRHIRNQLSRRRLKNAFDVARGAHALLGRWEPAMALLQGGIRRWQR